MRREPVRDVEIWSAVRKGEKLSAVGARFHLTKQRIQQIHHRIEQKVFLAGLDKVPDFIEKVRRLVQDESYHDARFHDRPCDHCGKRYQGPSFYCSLECAVADA